METLRKIWYLLFPFFEEPSIQKRLGKQIRQEIQMRIKEEQLRGLKVTSKIRGGAYWVIEVRRVEEVDHRALPIISVSVPSLAKDEITAIETTSNRTGRIYSHELWVRTEEMKIMVGVVARTVIYELHCTPR